jgi:hypothetical protein
MIMSWVVFALFMDWNYLLKVNENGASVGHKLVSVGWK